MKRLLYLITPLLIFTLLFSACSPTEKDNYKNTLAYFQIDFIKSDFETTESTSDKAEYVRAYKVSVTDKERNKLTEHFKSFENGEFVKIPNAQNNFDILCDTLLDDFGSYKAVSEGYFALYNTTSDKLQAKLDSSTLANFDFDFYRALIFDVDTNTLYIYDYSAT